MTGAASTWRGIRRFGIGTTAEAFLELLRARLFTLLKPRFYLPSQSSFDNCGTGGIEQTDPSPAAEAQHIGKVVEALARRMPFKALCLQQALATKRMLDRRGHTAILHLAVNKDREDRSLPARGLAAHAWVCSGNAVACGDGNLNRYVVVARFR